MDTQRSGDGTAANLVQHKGKELVTLLSRSILLGGIFASSIQHGACDAIPWCRFLGNPAASRHLITTRWEPFRGAHLSVQPSALIMLVSSLNVSRRFQALYFCLLLDPAKEQSGRFLCSRAGNSKRRGRQKGTLLWWESLLSFHRGELNSSGSYAGARALPLPGDVAREEHHLPARCWAWRAPRSKEQGSRLVHARSKCSSHSPRSSLREWGRSSWSLPFLCSESQKQTPGKSRADDTVCSFTSL